MKSPIPDHRKTLKKLLSSTSVKVLLTNFRYDWAVKRYGVGGATNMRRILVAFGVLALLMTLGPLGFALGSGARINVSQKGRTFIPGSVVISPGDTLAIHNDDEYVHQVFVDTPSFKFDTGEQQVGKTAEITFPVAGTFQLLCAIHPKMRLEVVVK